MPSENQRDFGSNEWLVEELYQRYLADPGSVDRAWWSFFADYQPNLTRGPVAQSGGQTVEGARDGDGPKGDQQVYAEAPAIPIPAHGTQALSASEVQASADDISRSEPPHLIQAIIDRLYQADQLLVADSIIALRDGAVHMLGPEVQDLDLFGPDGTRVLGGRWDVLQNHAELAFPEDHPYSREIIDASYDPAWRIALRLWAEQNSGLLVPDDPVRLQVFDHAAALDLDGYAREFGEASQALERALAAGRLPCSPELITQSPVAAQLAMRIWRLTSTDSPMHRELIARDSPNSIVSLSAVEPESTVPHLQQSADISRSRSHPQVEGDLLEGSVIDIFRLLFSLDGDQVRLLRTELRRQRSGTQYGTDIIFRARSAESKSTCLVECKNYTSRLSMSAVAEKLLQAEAAFEAEPVDHWILISPHQDPNNELDLYVQRWNSLQKFPFTVQIWSPQSGVRDLFAINPAIYRKIYGEEPPENRLDPSSVVATFAERLRPPVRLPKRLAAYISNKRSFVQPQERIWLEQLKSGIVRFGFDEKGTRLARSLQEEILSALFDSPTGSNVALLLAEFGEGKSFFTVSLCAHLQARYLEEPRVSTPLPVRLFLRGYRHVASPNEFLRTQLEQIGLSIEDWPELSQRNPLIVLDGLDEMSIRQDSSTIHTNLEKIGSLLEVLEGLPVLITSRPHFFFSGNDRERFYDRLRRPHIFRMGQPDRRETVTHLRAYADSYALTGKLNKIKELYDPIGLAGKVLFLEMIKETLPDLPEDRFDELVLYETYVERSLNRKIQLLRDPDSALQDSELRQRMERLLEKIAVAIHTSGEGSVNIREFAAESGGAANLLWKMSQAEEPRTDANEDAAARIGGRSLLRRVSQLEEDDEEGWIVDFFHRSMKEYFVAKAIQRALTAPDPFRATRDLLILTPIQPEILGFFKLLGRTVSRVSLVLESLAHSARVGSGQGTLGGGAISLYFAVTDEPRRLDWKSLDLDGAILVGANLSSCDFRASTLRRADLSLADLTAADLRDADLSDVNLSAGGSIVAISEDMTPHRYICLTPETGFGQVVVRTDRSIGFSFIPLARIPKSPQNLFLLADDIVLITSRSEFAIVEVFEEVAEEAARFRISSDVVGAAILNQSYLGLLLDPEQGLFEALLIKIDSGEVVWRIPLSPHGRAFGWSADRIIVAYEGEMIMYDSRGTSSGIRSSIRPSGHALSVNGDIFVAVTDSGQVACFHRDSEVDTEIFDVHCGAGAAVIAADDEILASGADGSIALIRRNVTGVLEVVTRLERRLRCAGARVKGLKGERERSIFLANDADDF